MKDEPRAHIDHSEKLCDALVELIDKLDDGDLIGTRASS